MLLNDKQAKMKLSAKAKKKYLERIQSHLKFPIGKVAMNLFHRIFFNFVERFMLVCLSLSRYKKMGVTEFVFEIKALKHKI